MKMKKILASVAASALAVSVLAVGASAAVYEGSIEANGAPENNCYKLAGAEGVDYSKVAKIEAVVTTSDYVNGTIGVSANGEWTTPGQLDANAGTATWVLDGLSGIDSTLDDGSLKEDVVQVQFWWLNAGTFSMDSLKLFDADGNVLQEAGVAADNGGATAGAAFDMTYKATMSFADTAWAAQDWETTVDVPAYGTYSIKANVEGFADFGVFCIDIPELGTYLGVQPGSGEYDMTKCTVSDLKVIVDGSEIAVDLSKVLWGDPEEKGNLRIEIYNQYGKTKDDSPVDNTVSGTTLEVQFTLAEVSADAAEEAEAPNETEAAPAETAGFEFGFEEETTAAEPAPAETTEDSAADTTAAPAQAGDTTNVPASDKGNADTGIEGVAIVAAVAVLAGGAVVIAKKRK